MAEKLDFQVMATTLLGAINDTVTGFLKVKSDRDPTIETKILYAEDKLDLCSFGEFVDGSYISVIYFYRHERDRGSKRYCGMFILYVDTGTISYLARVFGYKNATEAGDVVVADAAAELCNHIAGIYKKDLRELGYPELEISAPLKFKGFTGELDFPRGQKNIHRATAYVWGHTIILDVIMAL